MRKVKFKSVNELYGVKSEVLKVTSMVKGSFCSEKLADDSDFPAPLNMGSFKAEKGFCHAQFSRGKLCLKEESVKCSSCAPSCSPYVHSEEIAIKTNAFAGEACRKKQSNLCSFNDTDLSSHRVNSPSNGHHKSSMGSHPLSACLSHESSENAESGETCCDCNTSEGIKRIIKPNMNQTCAKNCTSLKEPVFHDNVVSNQLEKQASECLGDNISFICGSEHVETRAGYCNSDANKKNASYSSASINSFSETESASCYIVGGPCRKKSNRLCNESSQEILCCSNKSDFSEISSLRDSRAGASSAKGEHSECSVEQAQLSFARADAVQVGSQIGGEHNSVDSMQVDTGINEREQTDEVKLTTVVKKVIMEETTIGSWSAACSDGPDSIEYDVKVCDICGDIGREELLAVCSKCNDGAEHTYCMRVKMDSVPKGDWMCEECVISSKDNENRKEEQLEGVRILKRSSEAKALEVEKSKVRKACSIPLFSSKRPADSLQLKRKRPLGTFFESPSPCSSSRKTSMHQSGGHSCSTTMKTVCIPTESSGRLRKLSSQSQASRGLHFKSKSFSTTTLKEDVKQLKKGENSLPQSSSYSIQDLKAAKGNEISSHSLKRPVHPAQGGSANEEKKSFINDRQHVECPMEVVPATSTKHSKANVHSDEHPLLRDSSSLASKAHIGSLISAVPQPNYIWRGKFEIQSSGGLPFTCDGMQVHLSTYASDKVLELVPKLLQRLSFEEAPRLTMWPTQFMKSRATEDNVALYIFAKDFDSYEGSYKNLMDRMIKNDFSLKGNFGGVELLIFSSNLLPEKSRRWNNLLFLWGVFRGKMVHFSRPIPAVSASENLILLGKSSQNISLSMASPNTQEMLNSNTLLDSKAVTSGRMVEVCETKASSWEQKPPDLQISCSQQVSRVDNQIKNEQFSGADTYQIEEKESKKRPEIDLNCPLQESLVYSAGCTEPDGKRDFKMLKCSPISGMNICNNIIKNINERCAIAKNSQVPSSSGEFECYGVDNTVIASRLDSEGNRWKSLEQQFLSNNGGSQQDPYVSSSLGLKAGRNSSDEGNMPPFLKLVGSKDLQDEYWGREASGDTNPSLALSLALPDPNGSGVLKLDSERKLPPEVNTRLSLF
ncbi:uncharacterized protein LOC120164189 isoform X4 [Hibiscus syriacus]|uniref:uncharacterized protein LOC120164189 isoform X4 n=1 Tax=Hibiscus syriacus TaxID=106335 RepID=UPI00192225B5|nr:uncharacterized protein LOC120164189 isoform X4 [Hibiscus syriacus]